MHLYIQALSWVKKKKLRLVWTPDPTHEEGSGEKLYPEVSAVGVDEGKITSTNQRSNQTNDRK